MKNKILVTTCLLGALMTSCGPTSTPTTAPTIDPTTDPTTVEPTTSQEREFRFQVIHNVDSYNGQPNYIFKDDEGNLYAEIKKRTTFFVMFRYSPAIITMDDIVFDIEDKSIISKVSSDDNKYLKNKFRAAERGETTMTVYPEAEGIDSSKFTFKIKFIVY